MACSLTQDAIRVIENEILNLEFPCQAPELAAMDKYCLRHWLIGWATVHGWKWSYRDWETHCLSKSGRQRAGQTLGDRARARRRRA